MWMQTEDQIPCQYTRTMVNLARTEAGLNPFQDPTTGDESGSLGIVAENREADPENVKQVPENVEQVREDVEPVLENDGEPPENGGSRENVALVENVALEENVDVDMDDQQND